VHVAQHEDQQEAGVILLSRSFLVVLFFFCLGEQTTLLQVFPNDNVFDGVEDNTHIAGIRRARDVCVYLLHSIRHTSFELILYIFTSSTKISTTIVVWEADGEGNLFDLLFEEIFFCSTTE